MGYDYGSKVRKHKKKSLGHSPYVGVRVVLCLFVRFWLKQLKNAYLIVYDVTAVTITLPYKRLLFLYKQREHPCTIFKAAASAGAVCLLRRLLCDVVSARARVLSSTTAADLRE